MRSVQVLLEYDSSLLFLAPTGWGKTTLLLDLAKSSEKSIVYLSPLRALADEFHRRCLQAGLKACAPRNQKELNGYIRLGIEFKLYVLTAELLSDTAIERLLENSIVVFDEFHLFYYWGNEFRPKLMEVYLICAGLGLPSLLLSATAGEEVQGFWRQSSGNFSNRYLLNVGNRKIKTEPERFYWCPSSSLAQKSLKIPTPGLTLVFCKYRQQVRQFREEFEGAGYSCLSCVSGEVESFQLELAARKKIDFIFCTSTLSHGVNLPEIKRLCVLYRVNNLDMWLQMAGRAGRRGEPFNVVSVDSAEKPWKELVVSLCFFLCHYYSKKMGCFLCGLKALLFTKPFIKNGI